MLSFKVLKNYNTKKDQKFNKFNKFNKYKLKSSKKFGDF